MVSSPPDSATSSSPLALLLHHRLLLPLTLTPMLLLLLRPHRHLPVLPPTLMAPYPSTRSSPASSRPPLPTRSPLVSHLFHLRLLPPQHHPSLQTSSRLSFPRSLHPLHPSFPRRSLSRRRLLPCRCRRLPLPRLLPLPHRPSPTNTPVRRPPRFPPTCFPSSTPARPPPLDPEIPPRRPPPSDSTLQPPTRDKLHRTSCSRISSRAPPSPARRLTPSSRRDRLRPGRGRRGGRMRLLRTAVADPRAPRDRRLPWSRRCIPDRTLKLLRRSPPRSRETARPRTASRTTRSDRCISPSRCSTRRMRRVGEEGEGGRRSRRRRWSGRGWSILCCLGGGATATMMTRRGWRRRRDRWRRGSL